MEKEDDIWAILLILMYINVWFTNIVWKSSGVKWISHRDFIILM